ncbi:MBOAT family protein [Treponema ruminis]|uniref:D-alanyl-lipoteichoic acid acyltransferase DltB (MBOAT superfamily) n=1 Tax=Treponema ruminis TaxID=744515 RepID=A0A7W8G7F8_9SPIR|nr:MBOAT family protein [Treponema ruminis]MBB5225268.1 D-alanyl-lipoteichoic acid acyltransferase DltB (MBOAT superfamily) [Treponema ruminis]QSI01861.1 MBOAT family protein [Treponema ruminis]
MTFFSFTFAIFLLISLFVYYLVPKKFQWCILLLANTVFYAYSGIGNIIFILASSLITFFGAKIVSDMNAALKAKKADLSKDDFKIEKKRVQSKKRLVLVAMLVLNLGILLYLKYWRILAGSKTLLLPLGISYYTLSTIGYFMDIYNSKYEREHNFLKYFVFVSFFPQLILGPICRYNQSGFQFREERNFDFENIKHGFMMILYGSLKKYLVADLLVKHVGTIFDGVYTNYPGCVLVLGILMYSVYQYADFSGGTDLVLGIAELFGIKLPQNFKQPYFSTSLANFWQRWHITLGGWMRDYIFYPFALTKIMQNLSKWATNHLGKHFGRTLPACVANIIVFILVGVWHGPEFHFFVWGLYNGLVIAMSDILSPVFEKINEKLHVNDKSRGWHIFQIVRTFIIVNIGWYFDRIVDVPKAFAYLRNTFTHFGNPLMLASKDYVNQILGNISDFQSHIVLITLGSLIIFIVSLLKENKIDVYESIQKKNIAFRWAAYYVPLILIILSLSFSSGDTGFMYAQY